VLGVWRKNEIWQRSSRRYRVNEHSAIRTRDSGGCGVCGFVCLSCAPQLRCAPHAYQRTARTALPAPLRTAYAAHGVRLAQHRSDESIMLRRTLTAAAPAAVLRFIAAPRRAATLPAASSRSVDIAPSGLHVAGIDGDGVNVDG